MQKESRSKFELNKSNQIRLVKNDFDDELVKTQADRDAEGAVPAGPEGAVPGLPHPQTGYAPPL